MSRMIVMFVFIRCFLFPDMPGANKLPNYNPSGFALRCKYPFSLQNHQSPKNGISMDSADGIYFRNFYTECK